VRIVTYPHVGVLMFGGHDARGLLLVIALHPLHPAAVGGSGDRRQRAAGMGLLASWAGGTPRTRLTGA